MAREVKDGAEDLGDEGGPLLDEGSEKTGPSGEVMRGEFVRHGGELGVDGDGGAVVEWMGKGKFGVEPMEAVLRQRERTEEWRGDAHGECGGTEIVMEAGQRDLGCGACAAEGVVGFVDGDAQTGLGKGDGGSEAVGTGADDVCCVFDGQAFREGYGQRKTPVAGV